MHITEAPGEIIEEILNNRLKENHRLITEFGKLVQDNLNQAANIRLAAQIPNVRQSRIDGLVERLSNGEFEQNKWILDAPIVNFSQSVVDDMVRKNAEFHFEVGMSPKIVRKEVGNCCDWCKSLVGTYRYPDVPKDVYRRHRYCKCTVEYIPKKGIRQDVWSKKVEQDSKRDIMESKVKNIASGAKNYEREIIYDYLKSPEKIQEEKFAYRMYETIKNSNQEIEKRKIYSNIRRFSITKDFSKKDVDIAFNHVFNDLHDLEDGRGLFKPDFDMAHSWNRLINQKDKILEHDLLLLLHERLEHDLMYVVDNLDYDTAHNLTNRWYNYQDALSKWKKKG